ncbi:hypothetical protein EHS25_000780 [Saitozyma podzolica]|uniref:D-xylose 1-dehydrogenase (NADP(+), D-xylono-1,5-lactone-forming) n=1 Tax=Saitozyma podzolica TaxID=1890683 RepID=A0A427YX76_9TREE|nr:hypothetical protein EHS25_000780 [Saitozyma podzolica]
MAPFVASWGIIGCGWISSMFVSDLVLDRPEVTDVSHAVVAVGSRDKAKAAKFIEEHCPKGACAQVKGIHKAPPQAYGSYDEVFGHPDVNIIYIGTLHPTHYSDAKAALEAGKNVLVEKPACLNAAEWKSLSKIAKEKGLFLMEGLWTRFQPMTQTLIKKLHDEKVIGDIKAVKTDFSMPFYDSLPASHRTLSREAAGGPLMDLGPYILLPALLALYYNPANGKAKPENVRASMIKSRHDVDLTTTITLDFPRLGAQGVCTTSHAYSSPKDERGLIIGTRGEIAIHDGLSRITKVTIKQYDGEFSFRDMKWKEETIEQPFPGMGLHFEADAVARDIRDGRTENELVSHEETLLVMELLDETRKQGGYAFPEGMEQVV